MAFLMAKGLIDSNSPFPLPWGEISVTKTAKRTRRVRITMGLLLDEAP